jgi:hypothetical protein
MITPIPREVKIKASKKADFSALFVTVQGGVVFILHSGAN